MAEGSGMKWTLIVSGVVLITLVIISIKGHYFNGWTFFGLLFYCVMYIGGIIYIKVGIQNSLDEEDDLHRRKQRFDWCWERVNVILKSMPGGQGLQWAQGVGRKSIYKTFYDGIQNKPFRSMMAHLEYTQQLVLILYDIDGDDVAGYITNPGPDLIENPFLNFKPFSRSVDNRFDSYGRPTYPGLRGGVPPRRGVNITVGGDDGFDAFGPQRRPAPQSSTVDRALDTLEK
jgi:hypothetical protein